jgi:hypothetical protein
MLSLLIDTNLWQNFHVLDPIEDRRIGNNLQPPEIDDETIDSDYNYFGTDLELNQ